MTEELAASNELDYAVVDVFTDRPFAGNPLAVVLGGEGLSTAQMQAIALEFNLSETTFVLPPSTPAATYRLRIFTPRSELPFAGHPSVGSAWLLQHLGRISAGAVVQECGAGLLPLTVSADRVEVTGGTPSVRTDVDEATALAAVGIDPAALAGTPVLAAGAGLDWVYVHVRDDAVAGVRLDLGALSAVGPAGVCVFSYADGAAHSRCFAADLGVPEDPATGSAAVGLGVYLVATGLVAGDGETTYVVRQGIEMGRPSTLHGTVVARDGAAVSARVAGATVPIATGRLAVPPVG